jgi:hypothetical protein
MAYADLASNQAVSFNNLANAVNIGIFLRKQPIPATDECITKTDALNYAYLNPTFLSGKSSNQLPEKQNLVEAGGIYYMTQFGTYPVTGIVYSDAVIYLRNNSASTIYVYANYNSGDAFSGLANGSIELLGPPDISTGTEPILLSGFISDENQNLYSTAYYSVPPTYTAQILVVKDDLIGDGALMRLAYSTTVGGTKITL